MSDEAIMIPRLEPDCLPNAAIDFFGSYQQARRCIEMAIAADEMSRAQSEQAFQLAWVGEVKRGYSPSLKDMARQSGLLHAFKRGVNSSSMETVGDSLRFALSLLDKAALLHHDMLGEANEEIVRIRTEEVRS